MKLDESTAMDIAQRPRHQKEIESVKFEESQLRVFTEAMSKTELDREKYWSHLLELMKSRSNSKYERVMQFARYPLPVVQLSEAILTDLFKVFDAKNRHFSVDANREIPRLEDWIEESDVESWIQRNAMDVLKNKPNSFVVVDRDDNGIPYLILIGSDRLIDAKFLNDEGDLGYIAFIHSIIDHPEKQDVTSTFFSVYDEEKYFVFQKDSDTDVLTKVKEVVHGIGWCPGHSFMKTQANSKNPFKRRVAFTPAQSKMEDWTMFDVFRNYVDHYAPFPVTESTIQACSNPDCVDGAVATEIIVDAGTDERKMTYEKCKVCDGANNGAHIFPGTHIGVKLHQDPTLNDGSGMFKMIMPETEALKYVPEKLQALEIEIERKTVGINDMITKEAINEDQVKGSFASMTTILLRYKSEFDFLYRWIVKTAGRLMYQQVELKVEANFGTEWYLVSEDDLQKRYDNAKKIGLPSEEQLNIYRQLIQTKYKGNPEKLMRELMLLDLDPFPMLSIEEVIKLKSEGAIDDFELALKINFLRYISKFENQNIPITMFGVTLDYWKRIEAIEKTLYLYNEELIQAKTDRINSNNNSNSNNDETD